MAADFNAGSIEGSLELNTTPFATGLARAKEQGEDFESKEFTAKASLNTEEAKAKKTEVEGDLAKYDHKKVTAKADLDIHDALAKYAILNKVLDAGGGGKGLTTFALLGGKIFTIVAGVLALTAAAGPAGAALVALGAAGATAFGGIALSLGLFAAAAKTAFKEITDANAAGVTLTGMAGKAQAALKGLTDGWHKLVDSAKPQIFGAMAAIFNALAGVLPKLTPLLRATAMGVESIGVQVLRVTKTPLFGRFIADLSKFMNMFLYKAGPVLEHLLHAFMEGFIKLQPLLGYFGHGIAVAAGSLDKFASGNGLTDFIGYALQNLPPLFHLIGGLVGAFINISKALRPLSGPALNFLGALVDAVGSLNLRPLAKGFADVFDALRPILPIAVTLINIVLKPLGQLLSGIAHGPLHALTESLAHGLHPAFKALRGILHDLVKPLTEFAGSIANLLNPTGVHLFSTLMVSLQGVVHTLAPSLGKLAVALESVIDSGIETIIPFIPPLAAGLGHVATVAAHVADALAAILSHKAVVDIILGLVVAVKAYEVGVAAVTAITTAWGAVTGVIEAVQFGWAGLTVAQDANTASIVANKVGMVAWRVTSLAAAAASKAMAAAQWLLNIAMDANPIGLVVIAIAALVAGLILAWKHSATFRSIVTGAFNAVKSVASNVFGWLKNAVVEAINFVKSHWQLILSIMTGPIGAAAIFVITHFSQIKSAISTVISDVVNTVRDGVNNVFGWFHDLPGRITSLTGSMLNAGQALMGAIFHGLESAATAVGGFAAGIASAIWGELKSVLNSVLPHSLSINKGPIHVNVPLFPYLAHGGVTDGPMLANIGDNPGGQEAVVPLDKYDIPKRGEVERIAARSEEHNNRIIALLTVIAGHLAGQKGVDTDALVSAMTEAFSKGNDASMRRLLQQVRAA